jgi:hypothetical protein
MKLPVRSERRRVAICTAAGVITGAGAIRSLAASIRDRGSEVTVRVVESR